MAKRLIDTELINKPWYRNSPPRIKSLYIHFLLSCTNTGLLDIDLKFFSNIIGEEITENDLSFFDNIFHYIREDLVFIPSFVLFQCKVNSFDQLKSTNNAHLSCIRILDKYDLHSLDNLDPAKGLPRVYLDAKDKEKNKDKNKDMEEEKNKDRVEKKQKYGEHQNVLMTASQSQKLLDDWGFNELKRMMLIFSNGLAMKNYKYKDHYLAIRSWKKREDENKGNKTLRLSHSEKESQKLKDITDMIEGSEINSKYDETISSVKSLNSSLKNGIEAYVDSL